MPLARLPIRRRLMAMLLLTSGAVLLLTCASFFAYEFLTFRQTAVSDLTTLGEIIAANSTAALAFANPEDAREVLSALWAEKHVVAAALYDRDGRLFATFPPSLPARAFPEVPAAPGYRFERGRLVGSQPVVQGDNGRLGTLYLRSDMGAMDERVRHYALIAALVLAVSLVVAYLISRRLQRQISQPLLALAETARAVSDRRDYSVRAAPAEGQELELLTEGFNHMLARIEEQHQTLGESAGRLRAVLNSALSAVVVIDAQGLIVDWNARAEAMFGWPQNEALGRSLAATIIPPRYREAHHQGLERLRAGGEGPILNRLLELSALRRDGDEFPVELCVSPLITGGVRSFCGFITDLTERRQAQEKLEAQLGRLELLNRITRAIGERQDLPSVFQVVVRTLEERLPVDFGCVCRYEAPADHLTVAHLGVGSAGLAIAPGLGEQERIPLDHGLSRCIEGHLLYEPDVHDAASAFLQRLAGGGLRSLVAAPLLTESKVFGVLVAARRREDAFSSGDCEFLRQVSEHVALAAHQAQLHGALQQAYDDLRQTQQVVMQQERLRALGQMASGIAHDINNAISPVALYTDSLLDREPGLSERARDYLVTIRRAIDDVAGTVARMREFYRPREAQTELAPVALNRLIEQVVELTRARWSDEAQRGGAVIDVASELAADLPAVMGVEGDIRDALTNLIFNAVDAMPDGGRLRVCTSVLAPQEQDGAAPRRVRVEVLDTGVGMDEATRRRCLEPFFTTKGERGTGLGLAMVYGMAQRHGAELEIDSMPGLGTIVRLVFAAAAPESAAAVRSLSPTEPGKPLRILVVDDDPWVLKSLRDTLAADGHSVTAAEGGQAGIDEFLAAQRRGELFAVVFTDLGMPFVDGRKVAAAVRAASSTTPVILLTGWGQGLNGDVPPHVSQVLSKPPRLPELRSALANLTGD